METLKVTWLVDKYHYLHEREKGKTEEVQMSQAQAQALVDLGIIKAEGFKKTSTAEDSPKK